MVSLIALALGIVTGLGAVLFRDLIGLLHNLFFAGRFSLHYDANLFTSPSRWGAWIILAPVVGAVIVTFLVSTFAPEAKGHGVPEVMDAIYYREGIIRPVVVLVKSLASAIAIGSGSSVGREGPIIQIGSALGSTFGQIVAMTAGQRIVLVAAGAGAGIAATFNTPIGGVMFAIEMMLPEVSPGTFLPVAIATGAATFVGRWFFGGQPAFVVPAMAPLVTDGSAATLLLLSCLLGALTGVAAAGFIRALYLVEDLFERIPWRYPRHMLGMLAVGCLMYALYRSCGEYYVDGVGYATIQSIVGGHSGAAWLFGLLFACKLMATSISLGSGSSGGIFSPSLFMGATLGGGFAALLVGLGLPLSLSIPAFAMIGMGAMVGGATGAVMTAVTMTFEMTREYDIVMPMIVAVATSIGVRGLVTKETIYTLKLTRRGRAIPTALHANMFMVRHARGIMEPEVEIWAAETPFESFIEAHAGESGLRHAVITRGDRISGVLRIDLKLWRGLATSTSAITLGDLAGRDFAVVDQEMVGFDVIKRLSRRNASTAVVVKRRGRPRARDVLGIITKERLADEMAAGLKIYAR